MNILIRQEKADEFEQIYELVKIAFQTGKVSNGKEQDYVNELRAGGNYIPELALVAEEHDQLVGHIMLTRTYIIHGSDKYTTLLLAPISVVLAHRDKGIGSALIKESFRIAREMGYTSVFLVGDPAYYHRFGFRSTIDFSITNNENIPSEYVMACELVPHALAGVTGVITW